jgi:cytochrome c oxidase subunit II
MKKYLIFLSIVYLVISINACYSAPQRHALSGEIKDGIRIIQVTASRYKFSPDPIVVKLGEKVRLILTSSDVTHGIAISEFKVNVAIPVGKTEITEFIVNKKGTFSMHCSVYCGPGHSKMQGALIVTE